MDLSVRAALMPHCSIQWVRYQAMGILLVDDGCDEPEAKRAADMNARGRPKGDPVFDGWLNHHLSRLYGPVLEEPIPNNLLQILEERLG